ncbi:NnrU family protein [Phenylobacterium montanum]|uniref:NnrU family protein n=1 Tax=Phenylobacterium montanum TaxID=2823693 RepID=A0A975G079_9CAUL|nr:NnrU family protein [Caulobacter sp. S6]QUD88384.1 NnrU family protein [Caulobacter sp. S6]
MTILIIAMSAFLALHLLVSGTPLRDTLTRTIGEGPYMGLFSLASIAGLTWLIFAFGAARASPDNHVFWTVTPATRHPAIALVGIAFLLAVPGLLTNTPTRVRGDNLVDSPNAATGMTRISRHPFLWGVAIWATAHLIANGRSADFILFGGLLVLSVAGTYSIDAKRLRALGDRYAAFKAQTSNIPFAAILQGRQSLKLGEIWWRLLVAIVIWALVFWGHPKMFGVSPLG